MIGTTLQVISETLRDSGFSTGKIYRHLLGYFQGTPYVWGGNSLKGSDCSGSVCAALSYATNCFIRVPADDLYRRIFNQPIPGCGQAKDEISAAFFLDETGKAIHVAGYAGNNLFMNVSKAEDGKKGNFRTMNELKRMYPHLDIVERKLREDYGNGYLR